MKIPQRLYTFVGLIVLLLLLVDGCANEATPPSNPALSRYTPPDEIMPLPKNLRFVELLRAVPATNKILLVAEIGTIAKRAIVVILCDPHLKHIQQLLSTQEHISAIAASTDGRYVAVALESYDSKLTLTGSIRLIDLERSLVPKPLAMKIDTVLDVEFDQNAHLLASTSIGDHNTIALWNIDDGWNCTLSQLAYNVSFISSLDYLLCNGGEVLLLKSRNQLGCPKWSSRKLPRWDRLVFDPQTGVAFAGESFVGKYLGDGYKASKVIAFNPADGRIVGKWRLPYPESNQELHGLDLVRNHILMISQESRIVLHETKSMTIVDVLQYGSPNRFNTSAIYLPKEDAVYATNGVSMMRWQLR